MVLKGILEIHALDVLTKENGGSKLCCRMLLLQQHTKYVVIEPVLDYLDNDEPLTGMTINSFMNANLCEAKSLLTSHQIANGYGSLKWAWEKMDLKSSEVDVAVYPFSEPLNLDEVHRISVFQENGNICFELCC